jgi:hypothetical protein
MGVGRGTDVVKLLVLVSLVIVVDVIQYRTDRLLLFVAVESRIAQVVSS